MDKNVQGNILDLSNVRTGIKDENHVKQIKSRTTKKVGPLPQFQLNSLGGPLDSDFKLQD